MIPITYNSPCSQSRRRSPEVVVPSGIGNSYQKQQARSRFVRWQRCCYLVPLLVILSCNVVAALNGGESQIRGLNGWRTFEVISQGQNTADGWSMPSAFDGIGAHVTAIDQMLHLIVNHEADQGTISEVIVDIPILKEWIEYYQGSGTASPSSFLDDFVISARRAYNRYSFDGGATWNYDIGNFKKFCSSQYHVPNAFGTPGYGFVDPLYITGEEVPNGRLTVLDTTERELYVLTGYTGPNAAGMPADSWENAAAIDTREAGHIALLLSPDMGTTEMKLYVGVKGLDKDGAASDSFLAKNGLAWGTYYYLIGSFGNSAGDTTIGSFSIQSEGALKSTKLEDVDTNPNRPTSVVLGDQDSGVFIFDFNLIFAGGSLQLAESSFIVKKIVDNQNSAALNNADNVDWTRPTTFDGAEYPDGSIFVTEDNETGEIWQTRPDGSDRRLIGETRVGSESTGILDISDLLGYEPGHVLACNNQGVPSSLAIMVYNGDNLSEERNVDEDCFFLCLLLTLVIKLFTYFAGLFGV